ncbi:MAG: hypothetical protein IPM34_03700 [Saprospiraceae bacterium]|nr:hypothetical protein [Saprospiraceae bacterium]
MALIMDCVNNKFIILIVFFSCSEDMPSEYDCKRENYFTRFVRTIYDADTSSKYFMIDVIKLRYDRTFSHLVGKDCFPNRPDIRCVGGDFYIYNLVQDTIEFYMRYTKSNGLSNVEYHRIGPRDSLVIIDDPLICQKNSPGFSFYYK